MAYLFAYVPSTKDGYTVRHPHMQARVMTNYERGVSDANAATKAMNELGADWDWRQDFVDFANSVNETPEYMDGLNSVFYD